MRMSKARKPAVFRRIRRVLRNKFANDQARALDPQKRIPPPAGPIKRGDTGSAMLMHGPRGWGRMMSAGGPP